jgi:aspartate/methionine/tyrosine aminotransferase
MDVLRRANELEAQGRSILQCEVGQPATGAPAAVSAAAVEALMGHPPAVMGYTEAFGLPALRRKISNHYLKNYENVSTAALDISKIVVTTGSSGGFLLAFTAAFDTGDAVGIASSGYPCYRNILSALGCQLATIPLDN